MPYSSKKTGKNEITVYKKDSGEVVGHTTPEKYNGYMAALHMHEPKGMAGGGVVEAEKEDGMPADIVEFVEKSHRQKAESRPDETWRVSPHQKPEGMAPYKLEDELAGWEKLPAEVREEGPGPNEEPKGYAEGGAVDQPFDPNQLLQDIAPAGTGTLAPGPAMPKPDNTPIAPPPAPMAQAPAAPMAAPTAAAQAPTDQTFLDKANKLLGLNPEEQAGFMKMLGGNAQKAQLGSALAGIGDAIASGGTLGKVNPGALARSEELIQGKTKEGLEGMQTIRANQEKAQELADKLQARDPSSPLSKYAQKAYAGVGKKIGLDLSHASAQLIGDVAGKGVDALNTEFQGQLKMMGLDLQKQQLAATVANQKAERELAAAGRRSEAAKDLAGRSTLQAVAGAIPGTAANAAKKTLEAEMNLGQGPVKVNSQAEYNALPSGTHYVDSYGTEKVKK